jgi:MinD superfamily P-loop ATPase
LKIDVRTIQCIISKEDKKMRIAIASGKGGTGKTTIAVNLALALTEEYKVTLLDCDVEEPNSAHFLEIDFDTARNETVSIPQPTFDEDRCTHCRKCAQFCKYHAIAVLDGRVMFFPELCNGCGGCKMVCPEDAIAETSRVVGSIRGGRNTRKNPNGLKQGNINDHVREEGEGVTFFEGQLNPGEAKAVPVIVALKKHAGPEDGITLLDSAPGTSCPVLETVRDSDFCVLVTEPTPFGLHDLKLAVDAIGDLEVPFGVILNRHGIGDKKTEEFCRNMGIEILMKIPQNLEIARLYSDGIPFIDRMPELRKQMLDMFEKMRRDRRKQHIGGGKHDRRENYEN